MDDLAQRRFRNASRIDENTFRRGDGTRTYFFAQDHMQRLADDGGFEVAPCALCRPKPRKYLVWRILADTLLSPIFPPDTRMPTRTEGKVFGLWKNRGKCGCEEWVFRPISPHTPSPIRPHSSPPFPPSPPPHFPPFPAPVRPHPAPIRPPIFPLSPPPRSPPPPISPDFPRFSVAPGTWGPPYSGTYHAWGPCARIAED